MTDERSYYGQCRQCGAFALSASFKCQSCATSNVDLWPSARPLTDEESATLAPEIRQRGTRELDAKTASKSVGGEKPQYLSTRQKTASEPDLVRRGKAAVKVFWNSLKDQGRQGENAPTDVGNEDSSRQSSKDQIVKRYEARRAAVATRAFQRDIESLSRKGYEVAAQSTIERHVGCLRAFLSLGFAAGKTTVLVTYRRKKGADDATSAVTSPAPISYADDLERLASLRDRKIITEEEFQAKKRQILRL